MHLKSGWYPSLSDVTILTTHSKNAGVNFRLGMALHAFPGGAVENPIYMAARTLDLAMRPIQRKNPLVIKAKHPISPIMAVQASIPKLLDMIAHKLSPINIALRMAGGAHLGIETGEISCMATRAGERLAVIIIAVDRQAEAGIIGMVERRPLPESWQPPVLGMALFALAVKHTLMRRGFCMAFRAGCGQTLERCHPPLYGFRVTSCVTSGACPCTMLST